MENTEPKKVDALTLQEAKEQAAVRNGWKSFGEYYQQGNKLDVLAMMHEAMELYACAKWNQACEEQREICLQGYMAIDVHDHDNKFESIDREMNAIKFAPKPEFKP